MAAAITVALDLGSSSIKAAALDDAGQLCRVDCRPAPPPMIDGGRYECDAWAYLEAADQLLAQFRPNNPTSINLGLCCQRSSFVIWDNATGIPVTPLISWQDRRGEVSCRELRSHSQLVRRLTGLPLAPYYFAPKLRQVLRERPDWRTRLERGALRLGTLDSFLIWHWSGGRRHQLDASMAARTLLMDLQTRQWSPVLCQLFDIPHPILPQIRASSGLNLLLRNGYELQASLADQSAAVLAGIEPGSTEALVNLGSGGFVICCPAACSPAADGYLKTLLFQYPDGKALLAAEGTLNSIVVALRPYPYRSCRLEELAKHTDIYCSCEPNGIGAPYFHECEGSAFSKPVEQLPPRQIATLLLEGIIFRLTRIVEDFQRHYGIDRVYLSGGLAQLPCLQQGIALCSRLSVHSLLQQESSLYGAALTAAGLPPAYRRQAVLVQVSGRSAALQQKYARWQVWFDRLLDV